MILLLVMLSCMLLLPILHSRGREQVCWQTGTGL